MATPFNWPIYDLDTVWNLPDPVFEFLAGLIGMKPSVSLWYGAPGSFKTLILQDLAICVAAKKTWLDPKPGDILTPMPISKNYASLWIDQDSGETTIRSRFKALARGHGIGPTKNINWIAMPNPPVILWAPPGDKIGQNYVASSKQTIITQAMMRDVGLINFDNLGAISAGADENSRDMLDVLTNIREISEQTLTSVQVIHHSNKKGDKSQYGARGHTSILQAVDFAFEVTREEDSDIAVVKCTKSRHMSIEPFSIHWTYDHVGNQLKEARFFGMSDIDNGGMSKVQKAIKAMYEHFVDGMIQKEIVDMVKKEAKVGRDSTITAIQRLEKRGELDSAQTGKNNAYVYCKGMLWKGN